MKPYLKSMSRQSQETLLLKRKYLYDLKNGMLGSILATSKEDAAKQLKELNIDYYKSSLHVQKHK